MGRYKSKGGAEAFLYCIQDGDLYKIGWAVDPVKRLAHLQTGNPRPMRLIATLQCKCAGQAQQRERYLHKTHRRHRVRGEWFSGEVANRPFLRYRDEAPHVWVDGIGLQSQ